MYVLNGNILPYCAIFFRCRPNIRRRTKWANVPKNYATRVHCIRVYFIHFMHYVRWLYHLDLATTTTIRRMNKIYLIQKMNTHFSITINSGGRNNLLDTVNGKVLCNFPRIYRTFSTPKGDDNSKKSLIALLRH